MRALVLENPDEEPTLAIKDVPMPDPGSGGALVEVAACGLCYHDVSVMRGVLRRGVKPGVILGHEISGRVVEVGDSVTTVGVGDRVTATLTTFCGKCRRCLDGKEYRCYNGQGIGHAMDGGFAEYVALPESALVPISDELDLVQASVLACPMGVALQAVRDVVQVQAGETVLVTGAGGGLGVHVAQIASSLGARVLAVTMSPKKVEALERLACGEVVLANELDFSEFALALTEDQGVDVVVDTVGSAVFRSSLASLAQFGRIVLMGETTGERVSLSLAEILFRDATVVGSTGAGRRHVADVAEMVGSGVVRPVVSQRFALEEADVAYRLIRARGTFGRVVIVP